jgi:hypothetical protein
MGRHTRLWGALVIKGNKSLGLLVLEVFSIVLGVLLALGVGEWQQKREESERATAALHNVQLELQANQSILQRIHENNQITLNSANGPEQESGEDLQFIPGVQVRTTAWETLLATGVSNHIDYSLLLALSETYSMQSVYRQIGLQLLDASMTMSAMATVSAKEIDNEVMQSQFMIYFEMIVNMEETLLESYRSTLERIQ